MNWLIFKKTVSLIFAWCKKHIKFIFGFLLALALMLFLRRGTLKGLGELWESEDELYKQRKKQLEDQHENEIRRQQRHAEVEEQLLIQGREEARKLRSEHEDIIEENKDKSPEEIARLISEHTGWDIN
jgi:flagellar biosynthesis/type III secretory pathway M-ring protein FliF/YscJ